MAGRPTRAERAAWPLARDVVKAVALDYGACIRPVQLRKTDLDTGEVEQVLIPCGATLASVCPHCAERAKVLRAAQCREGWHLEDEPAAEPHPPGDYQRRLVEERAAVGRVYPGPNGQLYRPSMFITLTCPSYGPVRDNGTPVDPGSYDYKSAARDALHFAALFDRFIQNLRRFAGIDIQYFAAVEPQRRLAPHVHIAIRGTISRADLRKVLAATYHQVWWPATGEARFEGDRLPVWHERSGRHLDPTTGELLPTWDEALDAIDPRDDPRHVVRFGAKFDAQGVLAGSKDASRCIGYLTKYLVKQIDECHQADTDAQRAHVARLVEALRYEPCSPGCANWLRYGIMPKNPHKDLVPGRCKSKAHRPEHLGYAGRRVLVSRKWSGKTLADHRGARKAWLLEALGLPATADNSCYRWQRVTPSDDDYLPLTPRLMLVVADRMRWKHDLDEARRRAQLHDNKLSATGRAA